MPLTYDSIASASSLGGLSTVSFTSIPSSYTDLRLVVSARTSSATQLYLRFNADATTNYGTFSLLADGFSMAQYIDSGTSRINLTEVNTIGTNVSVFETWTIDVMNYAASRQKSCLISASQRNAQIMYKVATWTDFGAINTVEIGVTAGSFNAGSRVALYGILRA